MKQHPVIEQFFLVYPLERLWYLLFDYNRRQEGPGAFEDIEKSAAEPGYLQGMFNGFGFVLSGIDLPLSVSYLAQLHDTVINQVSFVQKTDTRQGVVNVSNAHTKGFRKDETAVEFSLMFTGERQNVTDAGLRGLVS